MKSLVESLFDKDLVSKDLDIFKIDFDIFRFTIVFVTGFINLRLLYNISKPLSLPRKILVYLCSIMFYLLLIIFGKFFVVNHINILTIVFIIILIGADIYIIDLLEKIYDRFATWYKKRQKRSRVRSEKR